MVRGWGAVDRRFELTAELADQPHVLAFEGQVRGVHLDQLDAERRPSHVARRKALQREVLAEEFQRSWGHGPQPQKSGTCWIEWSRW
jgi:hypothetical protein